MKEARRLLMLEEISIILKWTPSLLHHDEPSIPYVH